MAEQNIFDQFDGEKDAEAVAAPVVAQAPAPAQQEAAPVAAPEVAPEVATVATDAVDNAVPQEEAPSEEVAADVTIDLPAGILDNPQAGAIIKQLNEQWGGGVPIFTDDDPRKEVWDTYQSQLKAGQAPNVDEGKRLIPGNIQNAVAAGALDIVKGSLDFAGDALKPILPYQAEGFYTLAGAFPKVKVDGAAAEVTRTVTKYVGAAIAGNKIAAGQGIVQYGKAAIGTGFVSDFVVTNKDDSTLSGMTAEGLIEAYPQLEGPILNYLASDDKSENEVRFLAALEGSALVGAAQLVFKAVKSIRGAKAGGEVTVEELEAAVKVADEEADALVGVTKATDDVAEEAAPAAVAKADAPKVEPTSTRAKDFAETGNYDVVLSDGSTAQIYRDTSQFSHPLWHRVGDEGNPAGIGSTKKEALERLEAGVVKADAATPTPAAAKATDDVAEGAAPAAAKAADEVVEEVAPVAPRSAVHMDDAGRQEYINNLKHIWKDPDFAGDLPAMPDGTFNWSKMDSAEGTQEAWSILTKQIEEGLESVTGGVQSFEQTRTIAAKLADDMGEAGMDAVLKPLAEFSADASKMTARLIAAKQISQSMGREVVRLAQKVDNGIANSADEVDLLRMVDLFTEFTGMVKGAQTSAARMTSAGRIRTADTLDVKALAEIVEESGGRTGVGVLARRINSAGGNLHQVSKAIKGGLIGRVIDIHNEVFINGILSGVKTHIVNMSSNLVNAVIRPGQKVVGGALTGQKEVMLEGLAQYNGMRLAFFDSIELAGKAWKMEGNILDSAHSTLDAPSRAIQKGDGRLTGAKWQALMSGDLEAGADLVINSFGKFIRMPSRFLMSEDEFFKQLQYRGHSYAQATRRAVGNGLEPGTREYSDDIAAYMQRQFTETGAARNSNALRFAQEATFTNKLDAPTWLGNRSLSKTIQDAAIQHPLMKGTIAPFIRTPANLMRNVWDMSPLAPLQKRFWADAAAGGERRAMAVGKASTGSVFFSGFVMMSMENRITGGGPTDPDARKEWIAAGNQPYTMTVGGETFSYHRMDPFASLIGIAADFNEISGQMSDEERDQIAAGMSISLGEIIWKRMGAAGAAGVKNVSGKSYLQGMTEVLGLLASGGMNKERMVELSLNRRLAAYVPSYMQMYANDDELKDVRSAMDAVKARLPGYSSDVEARRDYLGQKMYKEGGGAWHQINPFSAPEKNEDSVVRNEVVRLGELRQAGLFTDLPEKLGNVDFTAYTNKEGQTAYDRLQELMGTITSGRGETLEQRLEREITSQSYQRRADPNAAFSDNKKVEKLQSIRESFKDRAMRRLLNESGFSDLADSLKRDSRNSKRQSRQGLDSLLNR